MKKVFIIAEAGVNHNGSLEKAKELIAKAAEAGADAIKFQTFKAENLVTQSAPKAEYQNTNEPQSKSQYEMIKKLELKNEWYNELIECANKNNIMFLSSPFDLESISFLDKLDMKIFKIPSGEITNLPFLRKIAELDKEIILSTGMSEIEEIKAALEIIEKAGTSKEKIKVLHCTTDYPTKFSDVNLTAMNTIQQECNVNVGYSDHTIGIEVPIAAVSLGAKVIEKHFTLDKTLPGPDHKASIEPDELKQMVSAIRNIEFALGNGKKTPTNSERKNIPIVRKSIVAKREIRKGEIFSEENLTVKRPGTGISPMKWDIVIGKKASRDFKIDELILL